MSSRYQQIEMPVNLTSIAADYLAARNQLRNSKANSHSEREARARLNALGNVLKADLGLRVQANFGEVISLVDALDAFVYPDGTLTLEWFQETADNLIDEYVEFARAAGVSMAKAIDAVEDAFAQIGDDNDVIT